MPRTIVFGSISTAYAVHRSERFQKQIKLYLYYNIYEELSTKQNAQPTSKKI